MGFSSRLKAHRKMLTLETLKFIIEFLEDGNARQAALRSGIPETYAARHGAWLKKHPIVVAALAVDLDEPEIRRLKKALSIIDAQMEICRSILGSEETPASED
jgi:hypothetical protein